MYPRVLSLISPLLPLYLSPGACILARMFTSWHVSPTVPSTGRGEGGGPRLHRPFPPDVGGDVCGGDIVGVVGRSDPLPRDGGWEAPLQHRRRPPRGGQRVDPQWERGAWGWSREGDREGAGKGVGKREGVVLVYRLKGCVCGECACGVCRSQSFADFEPTRLTRLLPFCPCPSQRFVVSGGVQGEVRVWELRSRELVSHLKEHTMPVTDVALFPDDVHALSCSRDRSLLCWDLRTERRISSHTQRMGGMNAVGVSDGPSGLSIYTVGQEQKVTQWDLRMPNAVRVVGKSTHEHVNP